MSECGLGFASREQPQDAEVGGPLKGEVWLWMLRAQFWNQKEMGIEEEKKL